MNNSLGGPNSRLDTREEKISDLDFRAQKYPNYPERGK